MLLLVLPISIAILLLCIIKIKLNPFVALLACAYGTGPGVFTFVLSLCQGFLPGLV